MVEWNERRLEELVRKMELRWTSGHGEASIYLSLYRSPFGPEPLLTKIMRLDAKEWRALGYDETERVSVTQYLGSLGCRTDRALWAAVQHQRRDFELAKLLVDAGCDPAVQSNDGWDALVCLAWDSRPVNPQVTDLFLSAGCRTNLDGCKCISDEHRLRFDRILKEHAGWKEKRIRLLTENSPTDTSYGPDWGR